jgi:hypothetical protein
VAVLTYTSNQLLDRVRKKAGWTANEQLGSEDTDLLKSLNEALFTEILPRLMKVKEEYFVITRRVPLTGSEHRYRIPKRAAGQKLRDIFWIDSSGDRFRLPHISREDRNTFSSSATTSPEAYYLENTYIVLVPDLSGASGSLEIAYFFRPGQLVDATNETRTVTGIAGGALTLSSTIPATFLTSVRYDIHSPDSGAEIRAFDIQPTTATGTTITFAATSVDGSEYGTDPVQIGDYVCLAGEAAVPGIPLELHPVLVQATVVRMAEGQGDDAAALHRQELDRMLQAAGYLFDYRVEGQPKKIVSKIGNILYGGGGWYGGAGW